jgi:hypothetical protein
LAVVPLATNGAITVQLVPPGVQLRLVPGVVPKLIALVVARLVPVTVTGVPGAPDDGRIVAIVGPEAPAVMDWVVGEGIDGVAAIGALVFATALVVGCPAATVVCTVSDVFVPCGTV